MDNIYQQKVINANNVFDQQFLDTKTLYLYCFNTLPSLHYIGQIDGEKAYLRFRESFAHLITDEHAYQWYKNRRKKFQFSRTILILNNHCLIEFNPGWCVILHDGNQAGFLAEAAELASKVRFRKKREPREMNLVLESSGFLELKPVEIKKTKLDLSLFYEDDFREVDELVRKRLNQKDDKGIVLLHGLPGAGKTSYLRYLIGKLKKRVLFLSPAVAGKLMDPEFLQLLIDNPGSVIIIEDAENILMDRKYNSGSSVSGLLNISDGLLADFLNVQLVCTFNSPLTQVDSALLRKGRLIASYAFGKLSVAKAKRLSRHLGLDPDKIDRPMTVAEIANPGEKDQQENRAEIVGFRRDWAKEVLA